MQINKRITRNMSLTAIAAATSLLAACGGGGSNHAMTMQGVVADSVFMPGSATDPTFTLTAYKNAQVCVDANNNGKCDASENPVRTDANGAFSLPGSAASALIADIGTDATNLAGTPVTKRTVFRVSLDQVNEQGNAIVISPLSAEVVRAMEANSSTYATEKQNLATRIGVPVAAVLGNPSTTAGATLNAMLAEGYALSERFTYAITKLDRHDLFPDALAVPGGDPRLKGLAGVTQATAPTTADTRAPITFVQSQQAAFNVEGVPRYDHIFIVMLENKATVSIKDNLAFAPNINKYLAAGNQLTSYFATGNPSEPNYTALGGADDFGITDDSQWNCDATGANAVQDTPVPDNTQPGLAKSPFTTTCTQAVGVNHNIVGKPNLFNALTKAGMTWRTYNESMNPGQDFRIDSVADATVSVPDNQYAPGTINNNATTIGDSTVMLPLPAQLYRTKHHPGMAYQNVRSAAEWKYSNRTVGGGQWDSVLASSNLYPHPANYEIDQLGKDLQSGNIGTLNFVVPDQCDDMHGITVQDTTKTKVASDCSGTGANNPDPTLSTNTILFRGDKYVDFLVKKIEASPIWNNPQKRVAIVLMFDEGAATFNVSGQPGFNASLPTIPLNSCCGWNPSNGTSAVALNADGSVDANIAQAKYTQGNHGHGESIFGILTNQQPTQQTDPTIKAAVKAPTGVSDSDVYSHFSFVRTLQDMFALADPADDSTYMNRSKYTENFIAQHLGTLQEYAGSADTHFDSVRPINHAFVAPATYTQKQAVGDVKVGTAQTGPDTKLSNVWAIKN